MRQSKKRILSNPSVSVLSVALWFILMSCTSLWAAAPITHAYLTYRFLEYFPQYTSEQQQAFLTGTLFPDIRYIGNGERNQTHFPTMTLDEVLNEPSPFMAGVKFHSYVDLVREEFVLDKNIYSYLKKFPKPYVYTLVKLLEDEILFDKENWDTVLVALKETRAEEVLWGYPKERVELWHNMVRNTFINSPSTLLSIFALSNHGFLNVPPDEAAKWNRSFKGLTYDPFIQRYVQQLTLLFEALFIYHKRTVSSSLINH